MYISEIGINCGLQQKFIIKMGKQLPYLQKVFAEIVDVVLFSKEASEEEGTWIQLVKIKSVWEYKQENLEDD